MNEEISNLCMQNAAIWCVFSRKMVHNVVDNVFLNSLAMRTAFPRVLARNDPCNTHETHYQ